MISRFHSRIVSLALVCVGFVLLAVPASAQEKERRNLGVERAAAVASDTKVALVVGNSRYKSQPLKNPGNDARAVAAKLKGLGFDVILRENLGIGQIGGALREFRTKLKPGAVGLFFYAGHGLQVKGVNYLPAVDAEIASEEDVPRASLNVNEVLGLMEEAKTRLNLVFLDACRDNPYARGFRSSAGGLAKLEAPSGTLISFATRPGSVAADAGTGNNGLYTENLLAAMDQPGLAIEQVLKRVVGGVKQASKGKQEPWMEGSIEGEFFFRPGSGTQVASIAPTPMSATRVQSAEEIEQELWNGIKDSRDARDIQGYLSSYPSGRFAPLAQQKLRSLAATSAPAVTTVSPAPTLVALVASSSAAAGHHDIKLRAPEIAENGALVPVDIFFSPPLRAGDGVDVRVMGVLATSLTVQEGELSFWSLRLQFPSTGRVQVQAGNNRAEHEVKVTVGTGTAINDMTRVPQFAPTPGGFKIRTTTGDAKILLIGAHKSGRLQVSGSGFRVAVSGSPYISQNPVFGFKGSIREGDNLNLSMM